MGGGNIQKEKRIGKKQTTTKSGKRGSFKGIIGPQRSYP